MVFMTLQATHIFEATVCDFKVYRFFNLDCIDDWKIFYWETEERIFLLKLPNQIWVEGFKKKL